MNSLEKNLANREQMLHRLRAEVVGPDPAGKPVTLTDKAEMSWEEFRVARRQLDGEEIVWQDPPTKRFGAGILFPQGVDEFVSDQAAEAAEGSGNESVELHSDGEMSDDVASRLEKKAGNIASADEADNENVTLANAFRPSAIGVSFLGDLGQEPLGITVELVSVGRIGADKTVEGPCGAYKPVSLVVGAAVGKAGVQKKVWLRRPAVEADGKYPVVHVTKQDLMRTTAPLRSSIGPEGLGLELVVLSRSWRGAPTADHRLITISIVNKLQATRENLDSMCLFQAGLRVSGQSSSAWIVPYPEYLAGEFDDPDPRADENVNRVLYRNERTFAIGHGCGADWIHGRPERVVAVWSDVLPVFETPSTSADLAISRRDGSMSSLKVSMRKLAGLEPEDDGLDDVDVLIGEYRRWIASLDSMVASIAPRDRPTATALIEDCQNCADRIDAGLALLRSQSASSDDARQAFRLANYAMLIAQLRAGQEIRSPVRDETGRLSWTPSMQCDPAVPDLRRGYWRPFQIAFLLMSLRGIVDPTHVERETVDLIWFPTGGGKTEAYLGLTAFTVFFNAMSEEPPGGVDVLMRYTLRLLTAQQFQRAATLFCAMEHLRRADPGRLGSRPFRIGLWVGGSATPNKRGDAIEKLRKLQRDPDAENPFVLLRCPWCAAKFGPHESVGGGNRSGRQTFGRAKTRPAAVDVLGYSKERLGSTDTVVYRCSDTNCEFGGIPGSGRLPLPIAVIDEDVLEHSPNLLIGTVDKFAMLAWNPEARSIFGIDAAGRHRGRAPTLVIQDELHLISGPLGSMVGAYETVIEALCIDPLGGVVRPKIVASTATISRAREQVRSLYARGAVSLFPPSGLDAADSFFAREAVGRPGRLYAGVLAPAHVSLQTSEARVFATLMQHAALLDGDPADLDPWWTLLVFFNSLRELGGALTLFSADTREYLRVVLTRHGVDYEKIRQLFHVEELTSRIRGDHIPRLLEKLDMPLREREGKSSSVPSPIDACLASNIIEVGVDIQRLSLMAIVGQPKTTSQYIQVSSRVGRDQNKPGLAVVIYGQTKPRDRSHYERFRSYHQKLYAQVEPTSVTPFSPPAVERSLHGLIAALVRQLGELGTDAARPDPFPLAPGSDLRNRLQEVIRDRVRDVAPSEEEAVMARLMNRLDQWRAWNPAHYGGFGQAPEDAPLMHPAGSAERTEWNGRSWATMSSLRNVDASCEAEITDWYRPVVGDIA
ncbi:helicase-related protein [Achromobacter aegrifaciens]|uniref:helicase-related protein n=1 Tax=Achromobacter aegrifaciens TaxID=1287736 RepID=UPI0032079866